MPSYPQVGGGDLFTTDSHYILIFDPLVGMQENSKFDELNANFLILGAKTVGGIGFWKIVRFRHCEEVLADAAIHSYYCIDCFVTLFLAMTFREKLF